MLVDNFEDEVIRKPDIVKKQRLMDTQHDYFDFQAKKNAMLKNVPVRWGQSIMICLFYFLILSTWHKKSFIITFYHTNSFLYFLYAYSACVN